MSVSLFSIGYKTRLILSSQPPLLLLHYPHFLQFHHQIEREMGNCQAIDAATLVIQHPSGKADKLYWPVTAREIMKMNPGHYVALLISTTMFTPNESNNNNNETTKVEKKENETSSNSVRLTRIKLLRPADTLVLGQVYRLITSKEVMKGLSAKKQEKVKLSQLETTEKPQRRKERTARGSDSAAAAGRSITQDPVQATKHEKNNRPRTSTSTTSAVARSRTWQPSLLSISEAGS